MAESPASYSHLLDKGQINTLVIGGGGREHSLAWKLSQSSRIGTLAIQPNGPDVVPFATDPDNRIDLVIVGPDDALADGMVDRLAEAGIPAFGPTQRAARIESSKAYAKGLMLANGVPTAGSGVFDNSRTAHEYVDGRDGPLYVKASGLALGKGAIECLTAADAHRAIDELMVYRQFGAAGDQVVIEDFLQGREASLHALCDGETYRMFPSAQDHKKADDGDRGLNTGGMGTLSPLPWFDQAAVASASEAVVAPVLRAMQAEGAHFRGMLFPGVMVKDGVAKVLEYNARFGDPETQVYMRRLNTDLLDVITATLAGQLNKVDLAWSDQSAVCLVAASAGYPGPYQKGKEITGIAAAEHMDGIKVFLAGAAEQDGKYFTNGGRVLGVTAVGATLSDALDRGYAAMEHIQFDGKKVRSDIGSGSLPS